MVRRVRVAVQGRCGAMPPLYPAQRAVVRWRQNLEGTMHDIAVFALGLGCGELQALHHLLCDRPVPFLPRRQPALPGYC